MRAIAAFASTAGPMFEPDGAGAEFDNPRIPAGYTYFGQFIDHDITFDPTSSLMRANDPNMLRNFRTPRFDLDSVYGGGPDASPQLYDSSRRGFFLIDIIGASGTAEGFHDLPRNRQGTALIGDPRNDENAIVAQVHLALLLIHNKVLASIVGSETNPANAAQFQQAQTIVRWLYQFVVWNDFVQRLIGDDRHQDMLRQNVVPFRRQRRFYRWSIDPYIPVEFSVAAYRFGHSMVRPGYQMNIALGVGVEKPVFDPTPGGANDLRGGRPLDRTLVVQWDWFFEFSSSVKPLFPQFSRKIDPLLSGGLKRIPSGDGQTNPLAFLNLLRGWRMELPSGPDVARAMGETPHEAEGVEASLWFYVLREAELLQGRDAGTRLGPVGGTIVGEVFAGMLTGDPQSYANINPRWTPEDEPHLPTQDPVSGTQWQVRDLIAMAGLPIDAADIRRQLGAAEGE